MPKKAHTEEQIVAVLRQGEAGEKVADICRKVGISEGTYSEVDMLWTIFVVLIILWLLGFSLHVGGSLIHLLLVVGLVVLVINLLSGRSAV